VRFACAASLRVTDNRQSHRQCRREDDLLHATDDTETDGWLS
jgi:hypothetical protein